ncbi:hypothetical protein BH11BAC2_BH11BAC2_03970 [soil metagenome]
MKTSLKMKKICFSFLLLLYCGYGSAQNVSVDQAVEHIGEGYNMAYRVFVPHTNAKMLQNSWVKFLKDNKSKVKTSKAGINGKYTVIPALGQDTISVFSRINQQPEGIQLVVGFLRNGVFISAETAPRDATFIEQILHDFAQKAAQDGLDAKSFSTQEEIKVAKKEQSSLAKNTAFLLKENEKMRAQIIVNDNAVIKNNARTELLKSLIETKNTSIDSLKAKSTELR